MQPVFHILEVANSHGGNPETMASLIEAFGEFRSGFGMKFQPFHPDRIAMPDFRAYELYRKLHFEAEQWSGFIEKAHATKDVWIDVFDEYSCEIIAGNLDRIAGLKFQPSILHNRNVIQMLSGLDLRTKKVMLNVSGIDMPGIAPLIQQFQARLRPASIILQVGFQAYPTEPADAGLQKIRDIRKQFPDFHLGFADHSAPESEAARFLPTLAAFLGVEIMEKHIRLQLPKPEYDYQSAMDRSQYRAFLQTLDTCRSALTSPFINERERVYLSKSIQIPIVKRDLPAGRIVDMDNDLDFRRTNQAGLRADEIQELLDDHYILGQRKRAGETLRKEDFKKANIAVIIGCRMKSTRLPRKAVLKIGNLSSVEMCLKTALRFKNVNHVILATSWLESDAELENHTYSEQVIFEKGHPDDVLDRYVQIVNKYKIDVVVRATADMPYLSSEIFDFLLASHFRKGADYTKAVKVAVGTAISITNGEAFRRAKHYFPDAEYSEYLTYYFLNNPNHFKLNSVTLPPEFVRDYRLTLDHQEDLDLFNRIESHLDANGIEPTLGHIFGYLDHHPDVASINKHITLKYEVDQELIKKIREHSTIQVPPLTD
jgi:spore coat polysaccharide biosynthesis protein SpsF (cytidylyltransferase family)/sialic acid synthase SpsE